MVEPLKERCRLLGDGVCILVCEDVYGLVKELALFHGLAGNHFAHAHVHFGEVIYGYLLLYGLLGSGCGNLGRRDLFYHGLYVLVVEPLKERCRLLGDGVCVLVCEGCEGIPLPLRSAYLGEDLVCRVRHEGL